MQAVEPGAPGTLWIVSAASGAGKTSLLKALRATDPRLGVSVSHTTRARRPREQDGIDYHFVTPEVFQELLRAGAFLEYAQVFDHYYGTAASSVSRHLATGQDLVLVIDWQGARQVREQFPSARSIFILPPSRKTLRERLMSRGQDAPAIIDRRIQDSVSEMSHYTEYDYLVINDCFDTALEELRNIVQAERFATRRRVAALGADFLQALLRDD
ncbi:guanylate kinase [Gammaproteobacteria bacterium]